MSQFKIRLGKLEDVEALVGLARLTFVETYKGQIADNDIQSYMDQAFEILNIKKELNDPVSTFFVAEDGENLVGYSKLKTGAAPDCVKTPRPFEFVRVYVAKKFQNHGLGHGFFKARYDLAQKNGATGLWLCVWENNFRGIEFHKKMGFSVVGERDFICGLALQRDIIMYQELHQ